MTVTSSFAEYFKKDHSLHPQTPTTAGKGRRPRTTTTTSRQCMLPQATRRPAPPASASSLRQPPSSGSAVPWGMCERSVSMPTMRECLGAARVGSAGRVVKLHTRLVCCCCCCQPCRVQAAACQTWCEGVPLRCPPACTLGHVHQAILQGCWTSLVGRAMIAVSVLAQATS